MMKLITNLTTIAVFLIGAYQTVCIVDGGALVKSTNNPAIKIELRFLQRTPRTRSRRLGAQGEISSVSYRARCCHPASGNSSAHMASPPLAGASGSVGNMRNPGNA